MPCTLSTPSCSPSPPSRGHFGSRGFDLTCKEQKPEIRRSCALACFRSASISVSSLPISLHNTSSFTFDTGCKTRDERLGGSVGETERVGSGAWEIKIVLKLLGVCAGLEFSSTESLTFHPSPHGSNLTICCERRTSMFWSGARAPTFSRLSSPPLGPVLRTTAWRARAPTYSSLSPPPRPRPQDDCVASSRTNLLQSLFPPLGPVLKTTAWRA